MSSFTKHLRCRAWLMAGVAVLAASVTPVIAQSVTISDANVEAAIREAINKPTGDLTAADLAEVTELDLSATAQAARGAEPLTQLTMPEGLVNLEVLNLRSNNLAPSLFSPLRLQPDMTSLRELDFSGNFRLSSFSFLNELDLTNLELLDLSFTDLNRFTLDLDLPSLQILRLQSSGLTEVNLPEGMTELTELNLQFNDLESMVIPPGMSKLTKLNLGDQALKTVVLHESMESLEELVLNENPLETVELPENLRNLRVIEAYDEFFEEDRVTQLKSFTIPKGYVKLQKLDLDYNGMLEELTLSEGLYQEPDNPNVDFILNLQDTENLKTLTVDEPLLDDQRLVFQIFDVLEARGVEVIVTIPPTVLSSPVVLESGDLAFDLTGPIRTSQTETYYIVYESTDLMTWTEVDRVENPEGTVTITVTPPLVPSTQMPPSMIYYRTERIDPDRGFEEEPVDGE